MQNINLISGFIAVRGLRIQKNKPDVALFHYATTINGNWYNYYVMNR